MAKFRVIITCGTLFLLIAVLQFTLLSPSFAFELIISDTGRNLSWSGDLKTGDSFSAVGRDQHPVGGILVNTQFIEQFVLPMPSGTELEQMSQDQERVWIMSVSEMLKDRVHIAVTNDATVFEIRLLQNTPKEGTDEADWPQHSGMGRFANMAYAAIGRLVQHLEGQDIPVRITTAFSDSGGSAFVDAREVWKPYADVFRRIDFVDPQIDRTGLENVIHAVGEKPVRLFNTAGGMSAPLFTSSKNVQFLLIRYPKLTLYTLQNEQEHTNNTVGATSWENSLRSTSGSTVSHHRLVDGKPVVHVLRRKVAGQEFRSPLAGWDPLNFDMHSRSSLEKLGVAATVSPQAFLPTLYAPMKSGSTLAKKTIIHSEIRVSHPMEKIEGKLANSIAGQGDVYMAGPSSSEREIWSHDRKTSGYGRNIYDPLEIKSGTDDHVVHMAAYRHAFPILSQYENRKFGDTLRPSGFQDLGLSRGWSQQVRPGQESIFPEDDRFKYKPQEYSSIFDGGQPPPPGPDLRGMRDLTSQMFPTSTKLHDANIRRIAFQPNVRGVLLRGAATLEGQTKTLNAGDVSLIFQDSAGVIDIGKLRRFVTSLWSVYFSVEGPGISIDPIAPKLNKHHVRYIGQVRNLDIGQVMRETDYLMKQWAIGTHRPDIEEFLSPDDFADIGNKWSLNRASRFWFIPEDLRFKRSGNMLLLSGGRMTLKTEYLDNNPKADKNEANERFAKWFTDKYVPVAQRYPIFQKLFDYAQLASLATYLKENRVPMLWFLLANRELILTEKSIDYVDKLVSQSGYKWFVNMHGGVELETTEAVRDKTRYDTDASLNSSHTRAVADRKAEGVDEGPVVFNNTATNYTVASNQSLMLSDSPASGDIIQTDFAHLNEYDESVEEKEWHLLTPGLELIRHYHPSLSSPAQFGAGWHLLVPFRLERENKEEALSLEPLPSRVDFVNVLSGQEETLLLVEDTDHDSLRYAPVDKNSLTAALYRQDDGSWQVLDKLGGTFLFDQQGRLTRMTLRPVKTINVKVGTKSLKKKIPGYIIDYGYTEQDIAGEMHTLLTTVEQGDMVAHVSWDLEHPVLRIQSIRIHRAGQSTPLETLTYSYGLEDRLANMSATFGRQVSLEYHDSNMKVVAQQP